MRNYATAVQAAGVGGTPELCQDALVELLEELFAGHTFAGQEGKKPLSIFRQDIAIPEDNDDDVDTDACAAPYILVTMTGGEIPNDDSPQLVEFSLSICAYDTGTKHEGFRDAANIKETIVQRICTQPYFGGVFTVLKPIAWAVQRDPSPPYYFAACILTCTAPAMTQDTALQELI